MSEGLGFVYGAWSEPPPGPETICCHPLVRCRTCGVEVYPGDEWEPQRGECDACAFVTWKGARGERDAEYWRDALALVERVKAREAAELHEPVTADELASLRALVENAEADALRSEIGNVLAALGLLGARREDGSRSATCPRGHAALVTARGRFRCSDPSCDLRTKDAVLRALVEKIDG